MAAETTPAGGSPPSAAYRATWRTARRQLVHLAATLIAVALAALLLSTGATALQAGREEARAADVALVVAPMVPGQEFVEHAFEIYRRGYAPRIVVVGPGGEGLRAALQERGVAEDAVVIGGGTGPETAQLREAAAAARAAGAATAVVAGDPTGMLRWLKLAADQGLQAYGSPAPGVEAGPLALLEAGVRYWRYVLFGD